MRSLGLLLVILIPLSHAFSADRRTITVRPLSLREAVGLALTNNIVIQLDSLTPEVARYAYRSSLGVYDPVLTLNAAVSFLDNPAQFDPKKTSSDAEYELETDPVGASLAGRLPTGLTYDLHSVAYYSHATTFFPSNLFNPLSPAFAGIQNGIRKTNAWFESTGATLAQPLLRDFWIDIYRRNSRIAQKAIEISELTANHVIQTNVAFVESSYFDLMRARDQIRADQIALDVATNFVRDIGAQLRAGVATDLDLKQAEAAAENARSALVHSEGVYATSKATFKSLITGRLQDWMNVEIEPSDNLVAVDVPVDAQQSWLLALSKRPDLLRFRKEIESQDINLEFLKNQLYPALTASGGYGWFVEDHSFSGAMNELRNGANPNYSAGLNLSFPILNVAARNNYKGGQVLKHQALLRFAKAQQDIITEVENTVSTIRYKYAQVGSTRKAREYAEAALDAQRKLLAAGRATPFAILEYQRDVSAARDAELQALADFNKAKTDLALSEGTILERHRINLQTH